MNDASTFESLSIFAEATQDLVTAGLEQAIGRFYACADACNQCAEKALQSVYVFRNGHRAPYDHDLRTLSMLVNAPESVVEAAAALSGYYPEVFYSQVVPEAADDVVEPEEATRCIARARLAQRWARGVVFDGQGRP